MRTFKNENVIKLTARVKHAANGGNNPCLAHESVSWRVISSEIFVQHRGQAIHAIPCERGEIFLDGVIPFAQCGTLQKYGKILCSHTCSTHVSLTDSLHRRSPHPPLCVSGSYAVRGTTLNFVNLCVSKIAS